MAIKALPKKMISIFQGSIDPEPIKPAEMILRLTSLKETKISRTTIGIVTRLKWKAEGRILFILSLKIDFWLAYLWVNMPRMYYANII